MHKQVLRSLMKMGNDKVCRLYFGFFQLKFKKFQFVFLLINSGHSKSFSIMYLSLLKYVKLCAKTVNLYRIHTSALVHLFSPDPDCPSCPRCSHPVAGNATFSYLNCIILQFERPFIFLAREKKSTNRLQNRIIRVNVSL